MQKLYGNKSFPIEIVFGIPLMLMPQWLSSSRTHHSAPHGPDPVIEDLAWSRDLSRNERMQQNPDLLSCDLAPQSGDKTGQVEQSKQ